MSSVLGVDEEKFPVHDNSSTDNAENPNNNINPNDNNNNNNNNDDNDNNDVDNPVSVGGAEEESEWSGPLPAFLPSSHPLLSRVQQAFKRELQAREDRVTVQ